MPADEAQLLSDLTACHVPDEMIEELMPVLKEDFPHSADIVDALELVVAHVADKEIVADLFSKMKEHPSLPSELVPMFDWLQGPTLNKHQMVNAVTALVVALKANQHLWPSISVKF